VASKIQVDERTLPLTDEAILCRKRTHNWDDADRIPTARRRRELRALGQMEEYEDCMTCASVRISVVSTSTWKVIRRKIVYSEGFLLAVKGAGRLPQSAARAAYYARRGMRV